MSDFQVAQRRILRERFDRMLRLIELRAPQSILDMSGSLLIRGVIGAVGPGVLGDIGQWIVEREKVRCGVCPFCKEERPLVRELGPSGSPWEMCAVCLAEVNAADKEAEKLEMAAEVEDAN